MNRKEIRQFINKWMAGHEPDTFIKDEYGQLMYTAKQTTLNLTVYFEELLESFIEETNSNETVKGAEADRIIELENKLRVERENTSREILGLKQKLASLTSKRTDGNIGCPYGAYDSQNPNDTVKGAEDVKSAKEIADTYGLPTYDPIQWHHISKAMEHYASQFKK